MISIIIPVYNVESYLQRCLDSCFSQTIDDIEVLATNDGSTDQSGSILERYALNEPRLKVFHQQNMGVVAARNYGLANASGQWIAFVDADDFLLPNSMELLLNVALLNDADISVGAFQVVDENEILKKKMLPLLSSEVDKMFFAADLLTDKMNLSLSGKLFRRSLFRSLKTDTALKIGEDAYITVQLVDNSSKVSQTEQVVYCYFQRASSVTHNPSVDAINSILIFINLIIDYYNDKSYFNNKIFQYSLNYFIMNQYFSYLRMGGRSYDNNISIRVNKQSLNDRIACSMIPFWRLLLLRSYRINNLLGKLIYCIIYNLRRINNLL